MKVIVMLKIKLEYRNAYLFGNVQPWNVMLALSELYNTPLYISEGVMINNEWEYIFNEDSKKHSHDAINMEFLDFFYDNEEP